METPQAPSNLRRRTLINNALNGSLVTSPLRKSKNPPSVNSSMIEIANDEEERADRRNNSLIKKRLSSVTPKPLHLSESYISEQFHMCMHLYNENKITVKNVWKLQIIDMLEPICDTKKDDILQVASVSLDICAKVYGLRVDVVHSEGIKLAGNLTRAYNERKKNNDNEGSSEEEEDNEAASTKQKKKKKKRSTTVKTTVSKKPLSISNLTKLEPMNFTTRVNADTGTIDNLYTNMLMESSSSFIILDQSKKFLETSDTIVEKHDKILLNTVPFPDKMASVNVPLQNFKLGNDWDYDEESNDSLRAPVVFGDDGLPLPELDGSINNELMDIDDHEEEEVMTVKNTAEFRGTIAHVVDFRPVDNSVRQSEYSFNSIVLNSSGKFIDQIWAGPAHWKLKCIKRSTLKVSGHKVDENQKRGRKKKQCERIDFWAEPPNIDFSHTIVCKKKSNVDVAKITLPVMDVACEEIIKNRKELMLRPGVYPVEKTDKPSNDSDDYEVNPYNYQNPNDSFYCSQSQPDHEDNADDDHNMDGDEEGPGAVELGSLTNNLIVNPPMVPNTFIAYAKKAKQVNMKKLKQAEWHLLTKETMEHVTPIKFSEMFQCLPKLLDKKECEDVSPHLAFVSLLHLCNENNLRLKQISGYKDCLILGPQH